jgi:hypothetical protein
LALQDTPGITACNFSILFVMKKRFLLPASNDLNVLLQLCLLGIARYALTLTV